jgi:small nuclear ribonucleoprotein (snRNP)-like protein
MNFKRKPFPGKKKFKGQGPKRRKVSKPKAPRVKPALDISTTGEETLYFRYLIDSESPVVVKLCGGEQVRGIVRYYDKDVFSLGQHDGPKLFLRKENVRYLYEEVG